MNCTGCPNLKTDEKTGKPFCSERVHLHPTTEDPSPCFGGCDFKNKTQEA
jgi:hypothetical protein